MSSAEILRCHRLRSARGRHVTVVVNAAELLEASGSEEAAVAVPLMVSGPVLVNLTVTFQCTPEPFDKLGWVQETVEFTGEATGLAETNVIPAGRVSEPVI